VISPYMTATMAGFGAAGYRLAVEGAVALLSKRLEAK
jgi:3-dehydroquinate dehydratase